MSLKNFEKILVTGARGNSAYFFFKQLEKINFKSKISVISRNKNKNFYFKRFNLNFEIFNGDVNDPVFLEKCLKNIDTILHTANMENSESIVNIASKKVKWIILVHSTMIFSKNLSPFIANRIRIDDKIKKNFNNVTILRPTMIYGNDRDINFSKLIKFMDKFKLAPIFGNGKNLLQPIFIEDLSKAYYSVIKFKDVTFNNSYNLAGREPRKYIDLLKLIEKELGKKIFFIKIPIWLGIFLAKLFKILTIGKFPLNASQIKRQSEDKIIDISKAIGAFNFSSRSFEDGIKTQVFQYLYKKKI